ncbi:MAG: metallophosphoesterase [Aliarcobacter sp.]|nr:metallophosphoesterase [Aliarcobacter sp.]
MILPSPKTIEIIVENEKLHNLKILHLSDLHINKKSSIKQIKELINICNSLEFDFAVITGDIIDTKVMFIKEQLQVLNKLKNKVYYISGNHDLFYGLQDLKKELTNFIFMDNKTTQFIYKNEIIHIAGLPDRFSKFFRIKREEKEIEKYLLNSPSIFISHQPKDYKIAVNSKTDLFLCGHTHGGQIFPFHYLVRLVQPFLAGLFYKKQTSIYVNKGLGTWGVDFRYKADNEISILKLIAKSVK